MSNYPDNFTNRDLDRYWGDAPEWLGPYFREIDNAQKAVAVAYAAAIDAFESRGIEVTDDHKRSLAQVVADIPYAATESARDTIEENGGGDAPALDALIALPKRIHPAPLVSQAEITAILGGK